MNFLTILGGLSSGASKTIIIRMFMRVFDEIISLIPVLLPAAICYLAIRKGWSFFMRILKHS